MGTGGGFGGTVAPAGGFRGSGDGYGDRWWLWGHSGFGGTLVAPGGDFGGQEMALGTGSGFGGTVAALGTGSGFGGTVALRTNGFGGTVALGMGQLWVQGGFEDGWQHNPG